MVEPPPKKMRTPTATLSKAPSDSETGTVPATQVSTPGEMGAVMALGASSLEDYLTGRDTQTSGTTLLWDRCHPPAVRPTQRCKVWEDFWQILRECCLRQDPRRPPYRHRSRGGLGVNGYPFWGNPCLQWLQQLRCWFLSRRRVMRVKNPLRAQHQQEQIRVHNQGWKDHL